MYLLIIKLFKKNAKAKNRILLKFAQKYTKKNKEN